MPLRKARHAAEAALSDLDLDGYANRFPDEMSGGQQQRVAIARALIGERRLVLAEADRRAGLGDRRGGAAGCSCRRR